VFHIILNKKGAVRLSEPVQQIEGQRQVFFQHFLQVQVITGTNTEA
jgi:hypothetical protein